MKFQFSEYQKNVKPCGNVHTNIMVKGVCVRFCGTWEQFMGLIRENYFARGGPGVPSAMKE